MSQFCLPYGKGELSFCLPDHLDAEVIVPQHAPPGPDPLGIVRAALDASVGEADLADFRGSGSAAIAINDKTRPVPHQYLLPPLLRRLEDLGVHPEFTQLIIATGAHPPMRPEEYRRVLPPDILARYPVYCHDADERENLLYLGTTSRGTPVWINRRFFEVDVRIVVGNIEPHQFQGYSGGVKSAAIGLAGRDTINHNHAMMTNARAQLGRYADNPARQDVEEIGRKIGVHFALNAILNGEKQIVQAIAGDPRGVMEAGITLSREIHQVAVAAPFDLVIASPGGHPKDINLYQSQKALAHASLVTRGGGTVIVAAACPEGSGCESYEAWMEGVHSYQQVFTRFEREDFRVGPHKAYQIARDAARVRVFLISVMPPDLVRALLLTPMESVQQALAVTLADMGKDVRVGIMPRASVTIPRAGRSMETLGPGGGGRRTPA
ncbi:MAG: nickel-dependent lactate racemase [Anaerolineae bacterium]|jgi:nickel-dependent lactate racemase